MSDTWFARIVTMDAKGKKETHNVKIDRPVADFAAYWHRFHPESVKIEWTPLDGAPTGNPIGKARTVEFDGENVKSRAPDDDDWQRGQAGPDPAENEVSSEAAPEVPAVQAPPIQQ